MADTAHGRGANRVLVVVLGMLTALGPLSIDTYLPAMPGLAARFAVDSGTVQYSLSLFFAGMAAGQLAYGPLSDRYGRRPILIFGVGLYLAASVACALAGSMGALIAARAAQGMGAAAGPVMSRAIVRDVFAGAKAASVMSFVVMVMAAAPLVAPLLGGAVLALASWRAIFWLLCGYAVLCLLGMRWLLDESHALARRTRDRSLAAQYVGYLALLARGEIALYLLCGSLMFAALFAYVSACSFVYIDQFGIDKSMFGLYFGANVIAMLIGTAANGGLVLRLGYRTLLGAAVANTLTCSLVLLVDTLTGFGGFWGVAVPLFFMLSTVGVAGANTVAGLLDLAPDAAGAASALFGVCQFASGAVATWLLGAIGGDAVAMALVMSAASAGSAAAYIVLRRTAASAAVPVSA